MALDYGNYELIILNYELTKSTRGKVEEKAKEEVGKLKDKIKLPF